jgi:hypothetical protein
MRPKSDIKLGEDLMKQEKWVSGTGQELLVHNREVCNGEPCPVHNPTDHVMKDFPTHWRSDRFIMERICPCGVGHPDPDDYRVRMGIEDGVHGCCGCCVTGKPNVSKGFEPPRKNIMSLFRVIFRRRS